MPARYTFLIVTIFLLILRSATPAHAGSGDFQVWGIDGDEFARRLEAGDHEFLRQIDLSSDIPDRTLREPSRAGEEALHMLGLIFGDLGLQTASERLFTTSWTTDSEPWRYHSLMELLRNLEAAERYPELVVLAGDGRESYPDDPKVLGFLISGLYRQEKDADVIELLDELKRLMPGLPSGDRLPAESALWHAVSASRLALPGWEHHYRGLYRDHRAGAVHTRVWLYLRANPELAAHFTPWELQFFEAKHHLADGRSTRAAELFLSVAESVAPGGAGGSAESLLLSPAGLRDFYLAGSLSGRQSVTAARLLTLVESGALASRPIELSAMATEYAGRLYRTATNYRAARDAFSTSLPLQQSDADAERVRWYLLSSHVRLDPVGAATVLESAVPTLGDPEYYDDLFAELLMRLSGSQRWDVVMDLYRSIRAFATAATRASYELVLAEALGAGRLMAATGEPGYGREALLSRAAGQSEDLYSAFVASFLLGRSGEGFPPLSRAGRSPAPAGSSASQPTPERVQELFAAFLRYGLSGRAYDVAMERPEILSYELMTRLAIRLAELGQIRESIQVAIRTSPVSAGLTTSGGDPDPMELQLLKLRYPRAFVSEFDRVTGTEEVDRWVLHALVREESLFDSDIVSSASAVGLTQLLRETADDVARRMRIDPPDLTAPYDNLRVGARYLVMLDNQFGGLIKAIAAYNAGQGRVRNWERARPGLTGVLFHHSIPYDETFNHIRQIVVSAVYYGYLYAGRTPAETIQILFRETAE